MRLKVKPSRSSSADLPSAALRSRSAQRKRLRDELEGNSETESWFLGSTSWNLSILANKKLVNQPFRRSRREAQVHERFLAVTLPSHDNFRYNETRFRL